MGKLMLTWGLVALAGLLRADLVPDVVSATWIRGESSAAVPGVFPAGSTVRFTNGVICAASGVGTNAPTVQDLTGLGGFLTLGGLSWTNPFPTVAVVAQVATAGTFCATLTLPAWSNLVWQPGSMVALCPVQLTLTNAAGVRVVYPGVKQLTVLRPLGP
ncbi:MAG: hypothetical protein WCR06_01645 [bacterium]